jgi:hypothetical protein
MELSSGIMLQGRHNEQRTLLRIDTGFALGSHRAV